MSDQVPDHHTKIIAIANQKGGVGKTTTAINLGAALAERAHPVLIVDMDPQGNASTGLGIDSGMRRRTTYDLILNGAGLAGVIQPTRIKGLMIAPSTTDLSSADIQLAASAPRTRPLYDALRPPAIDGPHFDFILIDCPPSFGLLTLNALVAAHSLLVPLQCEFFALEGLSQLILTLREVRKGANPGLRFEGVVLTMHDARNRLSQQVETDARDTLGDLVFKTVIPRNVRVTEAPGFALPVLNHDPQSKGSQAYRALADEMMARHITSEA